MDTDLVSIKTDHNTRTSKNWLMMLLLLLVVSGDVFLLATLFVFSGDVFFLQRFPSFLVTVVFLHAYRRFWWRANWLWRTLPSSLFSPIRTTRPYSSFIRLIISSVATSRQASGGSRPLVRIIYGHKTLLKLKPRASLDLFATPSISLPIRVRLANGGGMNEQESKYIRIDLSLNIRFRRRWDWCVTLL